MSREVIFRGLAIALPFTLLAACGGGSISESAAPGTQITDGQLAQTTDGDAADTGSTTDTAAATTPDLGAALPTTVAGRVADGYLQGAIVCVDANENDACDDDEPQATSGEGGQYTLDIPPELEGFAIIADVPATAIDEDTGQAIGKKLLFSTPGDRPEFVSPITTLVHEELKNNPALDIADAEATVLESLGMPDEEPESLFKDYVADSRSEDANTRGRSQHLHQTARVVASMMSEIRSSVESGATDNGIDVAGDQGARHAIGQLVREEIRKLLPEISNAVAERIVEIERANEFDTDASTDVTESIDPDAIASSVNTVEDLSELVAQIDAIKAEKEIDKIDMKTLLSQGFYIIDMECEHGDDENYYGEEDGIDDQGVEPVSVVLNDEGVPSYEDLPSYCYAKYQHISLDSSDSSLLIDTFEYDPESAAWVPFYEEGGFDEVPHLLALQNGQWTPLADEGPSGIVEFTESGGALLTSGEGKLLVHATERDLSDTKIARHLYHRGAGPDMLSIVSRDDLFPTDSSTYALHIKRATRANVLFNWAPEDDGSGEDQCAEFNGNCNVVDSKDAEGFIPLTSLNDLLTQAVDTLVLNEAIFDEFEHRPIDLQLTAREFSDDGTAKYGVAKWIMPAFEAPEDPYYPQEQEFTDGTYPADACEPAHPDDNPEHLRPTPELVDTSNLPERRVDFPDEAPAEYYPEADCHQQVEQETYTDYPEVPGVEDIEPQLRAAQAESDQYNEFEENVEYAQDQQQPDVDRDGGQLYNADNEDLIVGISKWQVVEVDGVQMIEIALPIGIRHRADIDEIAAMLLIEHDGFVRRGARLSESTNDSDIGYSVAAFETLLPVIEEQVSD